jgi:hypothetical protein
MRGYYYRQGSRKADRQLDFCNPFRAGDAPDPQGDAQRDCDHRNFA